MNWLYETLSPHWMFLSVGTIYITLEIFFPLVRSQKLLRKEVGEDFFWYILNNVYVDSWLYYLRSYLALIVGPEIWRFLFSFFIPGQTLQLFPMQIENPILLGLAVFFTVDFLAYWLHYSFHRFKPLWNLHILHHSVEELDWLSGFRAHWLDGLFFSFMNSLVFFIFKVSEEGLTLFALWETHVQFFIHSNYRLRLGVIGNWLNNNHVHWWHHARINQLRYGQNFGSYTLIWDKMFGTYYAEKRLPETLGLMQPESYPKNIILRFFFPLILLLGFKRK